MGCSGKRGVCMWIWIVVALCGITAAGVGTYFSIEKCSAENMGKTDCILSLFSCGVGGLATCLALFGICCLPARQKHESLEEEVDSEEDMENAETDEPKRSRWFKKDNDEPEHLGWQFDLFLKEASKHPEVLEIAGNFLLRLAKHKK
ncbi:unnamed protein product [Rodentolepis nana]|uniref:FAM176 domain-containing protein n=1 Tax=Rodentolepis nana TaxID=102285 RepID=A0A0R3T9N1_RODNA|nr:unnamed protein product [Rodentolepis nana]